jgi:hypothetical protein
MPRRSVELSWMSSMLHQRSTHATCCHWQLHEAGSNGRKGNQSKEAKALFATYRRLALCSILVTSLMIRTLSSATRIHKLKASISIVRISLPGTRVMYSYGSSRICNWNGMSGSINPAMHHKPVLPSIHTKRQPRKPLVQSFK